MLRIITEKEKGPSFFVRVCVLGIDQNRSAASIEFQNITKLFTIASRWSTVFIVTKFCQEVKRHMLCFAMANLGIYRLQNKNPREISRRR